MLFCYLVVEAAQPDQVLAATNSMTGQLKNAIVFKLKKMPILTILVSRIVDYMSKANANPSQQATTEEFKARAGQLVAAMDILCRIQEVFQFVGQHTEKLAKAKANTQAPGSVADTPATEQDTGNNSNAVTPPKVGEDKLAPPPEETIYALLKGLGMDTGFKSNLVKCIKGEYAAINKVPLAVKYRQHVQFVRNESLQLFADNERSKFVDQLLKLTLPELQDLALKLAPTLVYVVRMKAELAGANNPPTIAKIFGIPGDKVGEMGGGK